MVNFAKLNKTLKQLERDGVLVGPRATRGSYGDIANIMQASLDKRLEIEKKLLLILQRWKVLLQY